MRRFENLEMPVACEKAGFDIFTLSTGILGYG